MARQASKKSNDSTATIGSGAFIHTFTQLGITGFILAKGPAVAGCSNQSGGDPARSATSLPKAKPQSLPRLRDIRRAFIEADLVDTALRDSAFAHSEATPQVLSKAKNNVVALPGQLFCSTQIQRERLTKLNLESQRPSRN